MLQPTTPPLPGTTIDPNCPDSDDLPMSETDFHALAVIWLREALEDFFAESANVYVASNMLLYYQKGQHRYRRDPDVLVAKGVGKHRRRSFRTWEENTVPRVIFEVASEETWKSDLYDKPDIYRRMGVSELFLFDPENRFLNPPLQGFRLKKGKSTAIAPAPDGSLESQELGLRLVVEGGMLRLIDSESGVPVLTRQEVILEQRRREEQAQQRADEQKQRADEQDRRLTEQKQRLDALAAEVERLRKLIEQKDTANGGKG
jgi:Uma2 family endonuclease